jgi:hypothetical protein
VNAVREWATVFALVASILEFDEQLDVGNLLTSLTILISLGALLSALAKDRRTRERELGDRVRAAAARTLGKLERWQQLSARLYQDVQPLFVDVSQKLHAELDAEAARDLLWRELAAARAAAELRIVDEEIESAYVELYPYHPSVQRRFTETMSRLKAIDAAVYFDFVEQTQAQVLAYDGPPKDYTSALLGNDLRLESARAERRLVNELVQAIGPVREFLVAVVSLSDKEIVSRARLPSDCGRPHDG